MMSFKRSAKIELTTATFYGKMKMNKFILTRIFRKINLF